MNSPPSSPTVCTTCPYCGVGCGVLVKPASDGLSAEVKGAPQHPANYGRLCSKGAALGETLTMSERLLYPEVNGERETWDTALDLVAERFNQTVEKYGPDSVAFYVSGQLLTEDYYVVNKLMKGGIGSANIDTNSRLCMASSVAGHKRAFGSDTVPGCYEDLELAGLVVLVGSNLAWCHPVLHQRILAAKEERDFKLVVIDPRETATTQAADLHLQINPGSDVALFTSLMNQLIDSETMDQEFIDNHTSGMAEAVVSGAALSVEQMLDITGLASSDVKTFFEWAETIPKMVTVYSQGVNQSSAGTDKVNAIINCHLVSGRIGKPGMGPFSITGQPNAMGGREVGGLANQLVAHMDFAPDDIARVQTFWNSPHIASKPGLKAVDMFDAVEEGKIKAIWIMGTNPVVSMPNANHVRNALEKCEFVVVSDIVSTSDTLQLADVKLPAAGWGEKSGTVTNSERRISRQRSFLELPGEARKDWDIVSDVARRMGCLGFGYTHEVDIFREFAQVSALDNNGSRDFDIGYFSDISLAEYEALEPVQWPIRGIKDLEPMPKRFFAKGEFYTANKKAKFLPVTFEAPKSETSDKFPFVLNTGRIRDQWHTMTRTGKTSRLSAHIAEPFLEIHPEAAKSLGIDHADLVCVSGEMGQVSLRALLTERVTKGQVFAPMHWTDRYASNARIDSVVGSANDPFSGQPELKFTPVSVEKLNIAWWGFAALTEEPDVESLSGLDYWSIARRGEYWGLEMAGSSNAKQIENLVGVLVPERGSVVKVDGLSALQKREMASEDGILKSVCLTQTSGPLKSDRDWLCGLLGTDISALDSLQILSGFPALGNTMGRTVCSCMGVSSGEIEEAIEKGSSDVAAIGKCTLAGTNCGSCKPEIAQLLKRHIDVSVIAKEAAE